MSQTMQNAFDQINSYDLFTQKPGETAQLGSGHVCLKRTIMGVNAFFLLLSIILMAVGGAGAGNLMTQFAGNSLPTGIIVIGVFMMLVSLFGCVGAHRESRLLLGIYAVIVSILVICQIATGIAIYAKQSEIPVMLTVAWDVSNNWQKVTLVQDVLMCCGLNVFNATAGPLGSSGIAGIPCPEMTRSTHQTCMLPMKAMIESSFSTVGVVALCFAFLQIIGFGFAVCLIRGIRLARDQDQHADQPAETTPSAV